MDDLYRYRITWADGSVLEHVSNEHPTADHVANSMFGRTTALEVEEQMGHVITSVQEQAASVPEAPAQKASALKTSKQKAAVQPTGDEDGKEQEQRW